MSTMTATVTELKQLKAALLELCMANEEHLLALEEARAIVTLDGEVSRRVMQANQKERIAMLVTCDHCEHVFFPVPCVADRDYAHCPKCGEPHDMTAPAGAEVAPRECVGIAEEVS